MKKIPIVKKINLYSNSIFVKKKNDIEISNFPQKNHINKILIIKWGGMGDLIQSSFAINSILNSFSKAKIDLNTSFSWKQFFQNEKRLNCIWSIKFTRGFSKIICSLKWISRVRKENYDLIIDLQTNDRSRIYLTILKFFFRIPKISIGNHSLFPYSLRYKNGERTKSPLFLYQRTLTKIGILSFDLKPIINIPSSSKNKIKKILIKNQIKEKNIIIFIPGCSRNNKLKRWGIDNFSNLAKLYRTTNSKIILVGGQDDIKECELIHKSDKNILNLCNKLDLVDLIPLFSSASLIIANDTGPTHLAACTNTPTYQISGPTNPFNVKPFGSNIFSIQADIECKNCYQKKCSHHSCMKAVTPNFIFKLSSKNL